MTGIPFFSAFVVLHQGFTTFFPLNVEEIWMS
jgi:hypothetical protein